MQTRHKNMERWKQKLVGRVSILQKISVIFDDFLKQTMFVKRMWIFDLLLLLIKTLNMFDLNTDIKK